LSLGKIVMKMTDVSFGFAGQDKMILNKASVKLSRLSRVGLVGPNGAGKTTLLRLLIGDLEVNAGGGEVWKHHNLRVSYIAQHSAHHLEEHLEKAPLDYMALRFKEGQDRELAKMETLALTEAEQEQTTKRGEINQIVGRQNRAKVLFYECIKTGRNKRDGTPDPIWLPITDIEKPPTPPYVMKLVRNYDETVKAMTAGLDIRPTTHTEIKKHLLEFGIDEELATGKIKRMSGGQRSRLVIAAAMWNKPHLICLDEPTNFLDNETLAVLTTSLKNFKGGVVTVSHHEGFVRELCKELWHVGGGQVKMGLKPEQYGGEEIAKLNQSSS